MAYTNNEYVDMLLMLGECRHDATEAATAYAVRYPRRRAPAAITFLRAEQRLRETGSLVMRRSNRRRPARSEETEVFVLAALHHDPHVSLRAVAAVAGVSLTSVWRIVHGHRFHPYRLSLTQELHGNDFRARVTFCEWAMRNFTLESLQSVMFSDESTFTNYGAVNRHNMHYWAADNPRWVRPVDRQRRWSINVWCGILGDEIIGPHYFPGTLTGELYRAFIADSLGGLLEHVCLHTRVHMWMQHDGHPAHSARAVVEELNNRFAGRWLGRHGPHSWPARSPDLTPVDFFLWGYLKDRVYVTEPTSPDDLKRRIEDACRSVTPAMLHLVRRSFRRRIALCIEEHGHTFEHLM